MNLRPELKCTMPWENLLVFADGTVRFCCHILTDLGNLEKQDFLEVWNGPAAKKIRRQLLSNQIPDDCKLCPLINNYDKVVATL